MIFLAFKIFIKIIYKSWDRGDSNPGPPPCKGGVIATRPRSLSFNIFVKILKYY
jgi:hypothetical protein